MHSYEDRLRAVRLNIKLGKRVGLTIRQLGYPTKNALKSWHREFEQRLDLPTGYVRRPRYSKAQKERAVQHYLDSGRCLAATIRDLGYLSGVNYLDRSYCLTRICYRAASAEMLPVMHVLIEPVSERSALIAPRAAFSG